MAVYRWSCNVCTWGDAGGGVASFRECLLQRVTKTPSVSPSCSGACGAGHCCMASASPLGFVEPIREEARTEYLLCFIGGWLYDVAQRGHTLGLYGGCAAEGDKVGVGGRGLGFVRFEMFLVASACGVSAISYKFCSIVARLTPPFGLNAPGQCDSVENPGP